MDKLFVEVALPTVLVYEGGYVNDPADKGGATNFGVIQKVYDQYRTEKKLPLRSVKEIEKQEVEEIYFTKYWLPGRCDQLKPKIAVVHFDTCVNTGLRQAAKFLQRTVGAVADGVIGPKTLETVSKANIEEVVANYLKQREDFYRYLVLKDSSQQKFLKGWLTRVAKLREKVKTV